MLLRPDSLRVATVACPAKINWRLEVDPPRADGYHPLRTIFQRIELHDTLTAESWLEPPGTPPHCAIGGCPSDWPREQNLVWRAWDFLGRQLGRERVGSARFWLHKRIPTGGGLGGGSSDGAAALLTILRLRELDKEVSPEVLRDWGASLGADIPFFLAETSRAKATGIGENLEPLPSEGASYWLALVLPEEPQNTMEAYRALDALPRSSAQARGTLAGLIEALPSGDPYEIESHLHNDFERLLTKERLILLDKIRHELGAVSWILCGSGSTVAFLLPRDWAAAGEAGPAGGTLRVKIPSLPREWKLQITRTL